MKEIEIQSRLIDVLKKSSDKEISVITSDYTDGVERPSFVLSLDELKIERENIHIRRKTFGYIIYYYAKSGEMETELKAEFRKIRELLTELFYKGLLVDDVWVEIEDLSFIEDLKERLLICDFSCDVYEQVDYDENIELMEELEMKGVHINGGTNAKY